MQRILIVLYGVFAYCAFLGTILYAIGFVGSKKHQQRNALPVLPFLAVDLVIGIALEERDLLKHLTESYLRYRENTGMIFPRMKNR